MSESSAPVTQPDPLVAADVDCSNLDSFMLNCEKLMASELVALASHEAIAAALFLWCRAWKQRPAASLPDDERVLASFARLPLPRFRKLRQDIMRGFVLCSDGRWYHTVLSSTAIAAHERKMAFQKKRETETERLRKWRANAPRNGDGNDSETRFNGAPETRFVAEGEGEGEGYSRYISPVPSAANPNGQATRPAGLPAAEPERLPDKPSKMPHLALTMAFDDVVAELFGEGARWMCPSPKDKSLAEQWLKDGVTVADVREVATRLLMRRVDSGAGKPTSMAYLRDAMAEHLAARPVVEDPADLHALHIRLAAEKGVWNAAWGPLPEGVKATVMGGAA